MRRLLLGVAAGCVFSVVFRSFPPVPFSSYAYRDDAVITLSHARNLVDFGSIGVDPAGARVEGFSAPLQFWVYVAAYALTGCDYHPYMDAQTLVCTFLLGLVVVRLFRTRAIGALVCTAAVAFALARAERFFGWHGSGMENSITHVLFAALLVAAANALERGVVLWRVALIGSLAALCRLESIVHVVPLLFFWAIVFRLRHRSWSGFAALGTVVAAWGTYQWFRYAYFGDLASNTAVVQHIDVGARLRQIFALDTRVLEESLTLAKQIATDHHLALALVALPVLPFVRRGDARLRCLVLMLVSLGVSSFAQPYLFGKARLDPVRTATHLALVAPLLVTILWSRVPSAFKRLVLLPFIAAAAVCFFSRPDVHRGFRWAVPRAEKIADACHDYAASERLPAPSLANPDLGKISYRKTFNMFDLGALGSPQIMGLDGKRAETADYLFELAAPDFFVLHGSWACRLSYLQKDPRFDARYVPVPTTKALQLKVSGCRGVRGGIWFRRDVARMSGSKERALIDDLGKDLSTRRVADELAVCRREPGSTACAYVTRSVYRFLPQIARRGEIEAFASLFRVSPSAPYDAAVLRSRLFGTWHRDVVAFVLGLGRIPTGGG